MVVEIAAGTGLDFRYYQAGAFVVATEPDLAMLVRARRRASDAVADIVLVAADAQSLPFRAGVFEATVVALGLGTIPRPDEAIRKLHRVLNPAGVVRLLEQVRVDQPVVGWLQDLLTRLWRRLAGGCRLNQHTAQKVRDTGFHIVKLHSHVRGVFVTMSAEKAR